MRGLEVRPDVGGAINLAGLVVTAEESSERNELLRALLNLFRHDPKLLLYRRPVPSAKEMERMQKERKEREEKGEEEDEEDKVDWRELEDQPVLGWEEVAAMGTMIKPDHLQQALYFLTRLLDHRNHGSIRYATLSTLQTIFETQSLYVEDAPWSKALDAARPWIGFTLMRALLDSWDSPTEERSVLRVQDGWLIRLTEATDRLKKEEAEGGEAGSTAELDDIYLGAKVSDWLAWAQLARVASSLVLCTTDPYNLAKAVQLHWYHLRTDWGRLFEVIQVHLDPQGLRRTSMAVDRVEGLSAPDDPKLPESESLLPYLSVTR